MSSLPRQAITGAVLAGGAGRRMGGVDKGLVLLGGRPLVAWVLDGLRPQVGALLISANRSQAEYAAYGVPVVADRHGGFQGPLAGVHALLAATRTDYLLTVPCDTPRVPPALAERLAGALAAADAEIAYAVADGRRQPLHALLHRDLLPALASALEAGERKPDRWYASRRHVEVCFDDQRDGFININTPAERDELAHAFAPDGMTR